MVVLSPSEARKQFFHLGELAAEEPVLVPTAVPFVVTSVGEIASGTSKPSKIARHVDFDFLSSLNLENIEIPTMSVSLQELKL